MCVCVPPGAGMAAQPPRRDREAAPGLGAVYPRNRGAKEQQQREGEDIKKKKDFCGGEKKKK